MGRSGSHKRKQRERQGTGSQSGSSTSDTSTSQIGESRSAKTPNKKQKTVTSTPDSYSDALSKFVYKPREENMEDKGDDANQSDSETSNAVFSPERSSQQLNRSGVTNEDIMLKLCANGAEISKLSQIVDELRAAIFDLQTENDKLKKEVTEAREREELTKSQLVEIRHTAEAADRRLEDLSAYIRRNNLRIYGVSEGSSRTEESPQECEDRVLSIFNDKLKVKVKREDIEAVHRVGPRQGQHRSEVTTNTPSRGIIVRFVSRRVRDSVLYARKALKGSRIVIVEDLTPRAYSLLCAVKNDSAVCQQAWTKNGNVIMKTLNGKIVMIKSIAELRQTDQRAVWSQSGQSRSVSSATNGKQNLSRENNKGK